MIRPTLRRSALLSFLLYTVTALPAQDVCVRGDLVHTMTGPAPAAGTVEAGTVPNGTIQDGLVVVQDGRITYVGPFRAEAMPADARVLRAAVVTPGLIDAHSTVGLSGWLNQEQDQDQLDPSEPIQPELRALDAYSSRDRLVRWLRELGVTTVHTGHAPGALVSGQTMIVKTVERLQSRHVLDDFAMLACTLGAGATGTGKPPGNRSKALAMLRQALLKAREYADRTADPDPSKRPALDLRNAALAAALAGDVPMLVTAHRARDLRAALRLGEEFGLRLVLDGAAEAYLESDALAAAGVPVIAHAPMLRARGDAENATFRLGAMLADAGIPFAYQSGFEAYVPKTRVVLWEAAIGAAHGLGPDRALRAITCDAATILGVGDRVGSLAVGKHGDLALFDGDPFEYTSHCVGTVIEGEVVSEARR